MLRPAQEAELAALVTIFRTHGVTRYLEIGARHGESFDFVMRQLPPGSSGLAVDLPGGPWGKASSRRDLTGRVRQLNADGYRCTVLFGDCRSAEVVAEVTRRGPYDAVFIDADHRYESVAADFAIYRQLAPIVALHDIAECGAVDKQSGFPVEVPRLWAELRPVHRHAEIIAPESIFGIGVVYV